MNSTLSLRLILQPFSDESATSQGRTDVCPYKRLWFIQMEARCKDLVQCLLPLVQDLTRYLELRERHLELRHHTSK